MTRLCAEAMGLDMSKGYINAGLCNHCEEYGLDYNPLDDDAQAMRLVKKFRLMLTPDIAPEEWRVESDGLDGRNNDLNRAIVECVAKMQAAK